MMKEENSLQCSSGEFVLFRVVILYLIDLWFRSYYSYYYCSSIISLKERGSCA